MNPEINYQDIKSGIIDSHAHLVAEYFADGQKQVIERMFAANVKQIVNPGVDLESIPELIALAERYKEIYIGIGLHPHNAKNWTDEAEAIMRAAVVHPKVVAIGECGLDFHYNNSSPDAQINALKKQMQIAREFAKPLIIHCRNAFAELKEILSEHGQGLTGVLHCFTGGPAVLAEFSDTNFYISFSGIVTFPNAKEIQAAAAAVVSERLLVETDCPFLAPQKVRGQKNEPAFVWLVAEKLAELRSVSLGEIAELCSNNARKLFHLPKV